MKTFGPTESSKNESRRYMNCARKFLGNRNKTSRESKGIWGIWRYVITTNATKTAFVFLIISLLYIVIRFEYWSKYNNLNDMIIFVRDCISPQVFCHCRNNGNNFTLFIIFIVKSLQKEQNSTNLLLWPPICRNKPAIAPKWFNSLDTNSKKQSGFVD